MDRKEALDAYIRAANYLSAAQIFLKSNFLLQEPLEHEHIKPRLLGHWGTCPGINFLYAHMNEYLREHPEEQAVFMLGPGHGFAALQANLFMEETLQCYYPQASLNADGLAYVVKNFSWPHGFPSHSSPATPGVILEGGELGYSLATAYGAALDSPHMTIVCMVGDGEAETGPTAAAWHINKLFNPLQNGFVLPVLHLNGYKISGPTIFGRMSDDELEDLFEGYGYEPIFVEGENIHDTHEAMQEALQEAFAQFKEVRTEAAHMDEKGLTKRPPMIVLRTPKGWEGPKEIHGQKVEGNALAHQVVATAANKDDDELRLVETWLRSYRFNELFDAEHGFSALVKSVLPALRQRMGNNRECFGGSNVCIDLVTPKSEPYLNGAVVRGGGAVSSMAVAGQYLRDVFKANEVSQNFRLFSPDETYSNKLDAVFEATGRSWVREIKPWDKDLSRTGRVMEILSEHTLQGLFQGYVLTGRHGIFASYEAFLQIIASMADQYTKFIRIARETSWRGSVSSLNYILTSSGWRQEHNGFSHQNPGFIDTMLQKHGCFVHVYFPVDRNTTILTLEHCLQSKNEINLIVAGKRERAEWLTPQEAKEALTRGLLIWKFASDEDPDIVLAAAGDYLTDEVMAAITILKEQVPHVRIRMVNILELSALGIGNEECRAPFTDFADYFTKDKPVIFNFHGYPETLKQALFDHQDGSGRFRVHGYCEVGSTTTALDMHVRNKTSRYDLVRETGELLQARGVISKEQAAALDAYVAETLERHHEYICTNGVDLEEVQSWVWKDTSSSST